MKNSEFITARSPVRGKIVALIKKKDMTTAEIAAATGLKRERIYNVLRVMSEDGLINRDLIDRAVVWCKYKKPALKPVRELPHLTGTVRGRLDLSYMRTPVRAGSMDAYKLPSLGLRP